MARLFFLTLFLVATLPGMTQIVGYRVDKYVAESSIDTFIVYSFPCSGGISFDSCQYDEPHYLIWRQNGKFLLKRFDYCKTYRTVLLDTANPLTFYLSNKRTIDRQQIYQPTHYEVKTTKKTIDTLMVTSSVDHSCYHKFQLPLTKKPKYKYADTYDLKFKVFVTMERKIFITIIIQEQNSKH